MHNLDYHRIVEHQPSIGQSSRVLTDNQDEHEYLERFIDEGKPKYPNFNGYHYLIQTPFRYPPPVPPSAEARFRPRGPKGRNAFYASKIEKTAYFECSYYFMRERHHLPKNKLSNTQELKTIFTVDVNIKNAIDITNHNKIKSIMDRNDISASHDFVLKSNQLEMIRYPSCRCPSKSENIVIFDITKIGKNPYNLKSLILVYEPSLHQTRISVDQEQDLQEIVRWKDVC